LIPWERRPIEVAALLNPAFGGEILRRCFSAYEDEASEPMSFPLAFLILPIVLHSNTRELIRSSRVQLHAWLQQNPSVRVGFAERARQLAPVTRESITFLLIHNGLSIDEFGRVGVLRSYRRTRTTQDRAEVADYYSKAVILGRWFARVRSSSTIFALWGVRP
jgi:hypothetical protein